MRLDALNQFLGLKTPEQVFKKCPKCRTDDLFKFECEVFCQRCSWDSVIIHAEALAAAQLRWQQKRAKNSKGTIGIEASSDEFIPNLEQFYPSENFTKNSTENFNDAYLSLCELQPEVA